VQVLIFTFLYLFMFYNFLFCCCYQGTNKFARSFTFHTFRCCKYLRVKVECHRKGELKCFLIFFLGLIYIFAILVYKNSTMALHCTVSLLIRKSIVFYDCSSHICKAQKKMFISFFFFKEKSYGTSL
jgi:hypothetical protein